MNKMYINISFWKLSALGDWYSWKNTFDEKYYIFPSENYRFATKYIFYLTIILIAVVAHGHNVLTITRRLSIRTWGNELLFIIIFIYSFWQQAKNPALIRPSAHNTTKNSMESSKRSVLTLVSLGLPYPYTRDTGCSHNTYIN